MEKPNLNRVWHTWIKIGPKTNLTYKTLQDAIRHKIYPTFSGLMGNGTINWYHFLLHPYPKDDVSAYFHVRFSTTKDIKKVDDLALPEFCVSPEKVDPRNLRNISGIGKNLLKNEEIEEAWKLLGEQSEWIINLINVHKENVEIPIPQITQFMHFHLNMLGLGMQAILFSQPIYRF